MHKNTGFTLIELVIAMIVIAIVSVIALPKFLNISNDAELSNMKVMQAALLSATDITHAYIVLHPELLSVNNNGVTRLTLDNGETVRLRGDYPDARWQNNFEHLVEINDLTTVSSTDCDVDTQWCVRNRGTTWFANRGVGSEGRGFIIFPNGSDHNDDQCYLYYYTPNADDVIGSGEKPFTGLVTTDC